MKDLPPDELEAILNKVPALRRHFPSQTDPTLDQRVKSAREFLASERDDDLAWKHKAVHEGQLKDARQALGRTQDRKIGPPSQLEREGFTPRPGHEWLEKDEAAGLLECEPRDLRTKALHVEIRAHEGRIQYKASEILELAKPLIQKNAVRQSLGAAKKGSGPEKACDGS